MQAKAMPVNTLAKARARSTRVAATVFLIPALFLIAVFVVYPIIETFRLSTQSDAINFAKMEFIGFSNWTKAFKDSIFWQSFEHNLIVMVCSILLQLPIGFLLATFLDVMGSRKPSGFLKTVWFLPNLMSSVAIAFLFAYVFATNGGAVSALGTLLFGKKVTVDLLGRAPHALYTIIGIMAWQYTPFYMVYFIAGYNNIDVSLYEAAVIDGATRSQYVTKIALPIMGPVFKTACTMSLVGSLKYFDLIWNMTQGGPSNSTELMATYMYKQSFGQFHMGYGSCVAALMFILITAIALLFQKVFVVKETY